MFLELLEQVLILKKGKAYMTFKGRNLYITYKIELKEKEIQMDKTLLKVLSTIYERQI
jgi:hypothetical protein